MQDYKIVIKSTNQIEQTNTIILKEIETIEILLKKLIKINDLASINAYTYKNKYVGIDYSLKSKVKSVFNDDYNPQIQEIPFNSIAVLELKTFEHFLIHVFDLFFSCLAL